jgi:glycosyltransferase involved in cell wall biosynthesis
MSESGEAAAVYSLAVSDHSTIAQGFEGTILRPVQQLHVHFLVPGPLDQRTGGYLFDRHVVEGMRACGRKVDVVELPGRFPATDALARYGCEEALARLPDAAIAVVDGLALAGFARCLRRHARRLRIVGFVHHPLALETGLGRAEAARYAALEARLWPPLRGVICPSAATASAIAAAGVDSQRIAVAPPGTARPAAAIRRSAGAAVRLLAVGTLTARKGHVLLIEALAQLRDSAWTLVCAGSLERDPRAATHVRAAVAAHGLTHKVRLAGELSPAELACEYGAADVFALPSFHEGYGMAFAEALVHGLPIVATMAGAIPDTVPANAALFVPPGDVNALRAALARVIHEDRLRARLAAGAAEAGAALPSWPQAVAHWAAALDRLVA